MRFRVLKGLWRTLGQKDVSEIDCVTSNDQQSTFSHYEQHCCYSHRPIMSFESKQATLNHIFQIVECIEQNIGIHLRSLYNNVDNSDNQPHLPATGSKNTQEASSLLGYSHQLSCLGKETLSSCTCWREELITALDLCLLATPDDEADVNSSKDTMNTDTENIKGYAAEDRYCNEEESVMVDERHDVVEKPNNSPTCFSPVMSINTFKQWRDLLRRIVGFLLEIDRAVYVHTVLRLQHSCSLTTSVTSLQVSSGKQSLLGRVTNSSQNSARNSQLDLDLPECQHPQDQLRRGTASSGVKTSGINGSDSKNQEIRRAEERIALIKRIITWVILDNILRNQNESDFLFLLRKEESTSEKITSTKYVHLLRWDEIIRDLMFICGIMQQKIAESFISLWILSDVSGHDFVQSLLQKLACNSNDAILVKQDTATDYEQHDGSYSSLTKTTSSQKVLQSTPISLAERAVDDHFCVIDNVENMFKQSVVLTWVAYLEQHSFFLFNHKPEVGLIVPMGLCHCQMMATYAVCSSYWNDEKQNHCFHLLQSVWDEWDDQATQSEFNGEFSPLIFPGFKLQDKTVEKCYTSNSHVLSKDINGECSETILNGLTKGACVRNPTLEKEKERDKNVSDADAILTSSISVSTMPQLCSLTIPRGTEANCLPSEEDTVTFLAIELWLIILHLRVEQCLINGDQQRFREAEHLQSKEREIAYAICSFSYSQKALESLVKVQLAVGNYSAAFGSASAHFANVENEYLWENYCDRCMITFFNSILLLTQTQEIFKADSSFDKVAQTAIRHLNFCEKTFIFPLSTSKAHIVRHTAARRSAYDAKASCLREIWRAYYRLNDAVNASNYFEKYIQHITFKYDMKQNEITYAAFKERGKQFEEEKQYDDAVYMFKRAVEEAKKYITLLSTSTTPKIKRINMKPDTFEDDSATQVMGNVMMESELKFVRCEAESERNLALAYVKQAKHEVNVKRRRQQLNNAATSAYTALDMLQRCMLKANKSPPPAGMLLDVASSIVVAAKALLRLGQPKKAALLLEPLIEEKANSCSVRPALWSKVPPSSQAAQSFTLAEMAECLETVKVKIAAFELHTLCLSKFDGERACREIAAAREFLLEVKEWLNLFLLNNQAAIPNDKGENIVILEEDFLIKTDLQKNTVYQVLEMTNTLLSDLVITFGDSLALLGKWEDALQEYSNALAMYAEGSRDGDNSGYSHVKTKKDNEHLQNDKKIGESLVLAKLAEVYIALNKPKTAAHYYHQVLDYALEVGDAVVEYNALINLARLYTITKETEDVGEHWAKVSELAKEYEDQVISRETTRNIVAAQRTKGMYTAVLNTAKELDDLASASEGVNAAADRQFALEALADAYLQLCQYKNCIETLDTLEKVQHKCGQWKDPLFKIRAQALIGDGAVKEAIKILMTWACDARKFGNLVELGHANNGLALAYSSLGCFLKTRQRYETALYTFSEVLSMDRECYSAVRESAQWLLYYFYLNNEEILLNNNCNEKEECSSLDQSEEAGSKKDHSSFSVVSSNSGDLSVLMQKEEISRAKQLESGAAVSIISSNGDCSGSGISNTRWMRSEESDKSSFMNAGCCDAETTENDVFSLSGANFKDCSAKKDVILKYQANASTPATCGISALQQLQSTPTQTLANVTHCKHPSVMDGKVFLPYEPSTATASECLQEKQYFLRNCAVKVRTFCFRRALETIEMAAQLSLIPLSIRKQLIPRNPADVIDLALMAYPKCTFVFYCVEFGAQYRAIVRPASSLFFFERSLHVFSLSEFHSKSHYEKSLSQESKASVNNEPVRHVRNEQSERRTSAFTSLSSLAWRSRSNISETTNVLRDQDNNSVEMNKSLEHQLQNLYADLWKPVQDSLRANNCCGEETDCLVLVVDPTLLHIPFSALCSFEAGAISLGQQFTLVVTPTVVSFLQNMRCCEESSLPFAPQIDSIVLLPEQAEKTRFLSSSPFATPTKSSASTVKASTNTPTEDQHIASATTANACWPAGISKSWTIFTGCTRKEVISAFTSLSCRVLMLLCDPVGHLFRVADGMLRLEDMTREAPSLADSHDLIVVTCDRSVAPSVDEPGVAARLCLHHACRRVLRLDLPHGMSSILAEHVQLLQLYVENLTLTLRWRMRYPYALALQMTQKEALRRKFDTVVWASLTLIGAP